MRFRSQGTAIQSVCYCQRVDTFHADSVLSWLLFEGNRVASSECSIGRTAKYIWSKLNFPSNNKTCRSLFEVSSLSFSLIWFYFTCLPFGGETLFVDYGGEK